MRRFSFPLEGLLRVRQVAEQEAEQGLQWARRRWQAAQGLLARREEEYRRALGCWEEGLLAQAEAPLLTLMVCYCRRKEQERWRAAQRVAEAQAEVERCLEEYWLRRRERELVEELRRRAWRQWRAEEERAEQHRADERALRDFALGRREKKP